MGKFIGIDLVREPQVILTLRTCCRCGVEFRSFAQRVCPACRKPKATYTDVRAKAPISKLYPREVQVAELVARGLSNKAIAWQLKLSEGTVKVYLVHIFDKLQVNNRVELAIWIVARQPQLQRTAFEYGYT